MPSICPLLLAASSASAESTLFWAYLADVLVLLAGALVVGAVFEWFRQSAIIGYLLAGTLLGPNALGLVRHEEAVSTLAELGVALLLFTIGLEFSWARLRRMGMKTLVTGSLQIGVTLTLVALVAGLWLPVGAAVAVGAMAALSSTAVVLRTLQDRGEIDSLHGRAALGVLLVQDVAVVPMVLLIEAIGGGGSVLSMLGEMGLDLVLGLALVAGFVVLARYGLPWLLRYRSQSKNRDFPILFAVVAGLGSAWAAYGAGLSPALGAFIAGVILGGSPLAISTRADVGPLKTLFVTLFFSAIGMLADPAWIAGHAVLVVAVLLAIVLGNALILWALGRVLGLAHRQAVAVGMTLAQVGEFSFVLATVALGSGVIDTDTFALMVSVTIATLFVTPYLIAGAPRVGAWSERLIRRQQRKRGRPAPTSREAESTAMADHIVIIGFGPCGQAVAEAMGRAEPKPPVTVIDLNPSTVFSARNAGYTAYLGDASTHEVIEHARMASARAIVITLPEPRATATIIERVRADCPGLRIFARSRYHIHVGYLRLSGASVVVDEEEQVGQGLGTKILETL